MKKIKLTKGMVALVDDGDYDALSCYRWNAWWNHDVNSYYAVRYEGRTFVLMHRQIMGFKPGDGKQVDHANPARTLDNRRNNLREADHSKNACNRRMLTRNKSGVKGIYYDVARERWVAQLTIRKQRVLMKRFKSKKAAMSVYRAAAKQYHGEFARVA